ncbi:unnamed protein product [Brugia pahangi]|uniref:Requiem_N domain-containing protein n=1 Tax=Brugia pahangi TaxID=6280 RepID=A0A0N4TBA6_BRUPA|nr:unnamed protein product [Brugia pahangi]
MISESLYIEMMKNCSKWNSRVETERKGRYTVLDPQTGIAQHPSHHAIYELSNRYPPSNPSQVYQHNFSFIKMKFPSYIRIIYSTITYYNNEVFSCFFFLASK